MTQGGRSPERRPEQAPTMRGGPAPAQLADVLERVLDKGIVVAGDISISLIDIELLTIKLRLLIASADKAVQELSPPVPLELLNFGVFATLAELGDARLREVPPSPAGGLIADYLGPIDDPRRLAARLAETPGVVEHGLFAPELVSEILIARPEGVERRAGARPAS